MSSSSSSDDESSTSSNSLQEIEKPTTNEKETTKPASTPQDGDLKRSKTTLFVRNLPFDLNSQGLSDYFSEYGPLRSAFVVNDDKNQGSNKGIGFVTFAIEQDAISCVEKLHGKPFSQDKPRKLKIEFAVAKQIVKQSKEEGSTISIPHGKPKSVRQPQESKVTVVKITGLGDVSEKQLYKKVRKYGKLASTHSVQVSNGEAFVTFVSLPQAQQALKHLNGHIFKGNKMTAIIDDDKTVEAKTQHATQLSDAKSLERWIKKNPRLIVRNIHFSTGEKHLKKLFSIPDTQVTKIHLPTNAQGKPSGFAFVTFANSDQAKVAIAKVNGQKLLGREVAVDWALPKGMWEKAKDQEPEETQASEQESEKESTVESDNPDEFASDDDQIGVMDDDSDAVLSQDEDSEPETVQPEEDDETTLFIRNISYNVTEKDLYSKFSKFGPLKYARLVMDHVSGLPKGTGFVRFWKAGDRKRCLDEYDVAVKEVDAQKKDERLSKVKAKGAKTPSILLAEPSLTSSTTPFILDSRFLHILPYVAPEDANALSNQHKLDRRQKDKRNLYLMREGVIFPEMPAAKTLSALEVEKRVQAYNERRELLAKNPNLFCSKTRLSIRNLWLKVDDKQLKQICRNAIDNFWQEVESGEREAMELEALEGLAKDGSKRPFPKAAIKQVKIMRDTERIDPETQLPRSRGFAFVEFVRHMDALACLRWLNNNPRAYDVIGDVDAKKRPIVEFAVENNLVLKRRSERKPGTDKKRKRDDQEEEPRKKAKTSVKHERWNQPSKPKKRPLAEQDDKPAKRPKIEKKEEKAKSTKSIVHDKPKKQESTKTRGKSAGKVKEDAPGQTRPKKNKEKRDATDDLVDKYKKQLLDSNKWRI